MPIAPGQLQVGGRRVVGAGTPGAVVGEDPGTVGTGEVVGEVVGLGLLRVGVVGIGLPPGNKDAYVEQCYLTDRKCVA